MNYKLSEEIENAKNHLVINVETGNMEDFKRAIAFLDDLKDSLEVLKSYHTNMEHNDCPLTKFFTMFEANESVKIDDWDLWGAS